MFRMTLETLAKPVPPATTSAVISASTCEIVLFVGSDRLFAMPAHKVRKRLI